MKLDSYYLERSAKLTFDFVSEGQKKILKRIQFTRILQPEEYGLPKGSELYNLGFGDVVLDIETNQEFVSDSERSNNGDKLKVLNTVATSILLFFEVYPDAFILVEGNSASRNREYRIGISKIYEGISDRFEIAGLIEEIEVAYWEDYIPNRDYSAFLMRKK